MATGDGGPREDRGFETGFTGLDCSEFRLEGRVGMLLSSSRMQAFVTRNTEDFAPGKLDTMMSG